MKIKVSIAIVLMTTVALIGVMALMLNRTSKTETQAELLEPTDVVSEKAVEIVAEPLPVKKPLEIKAKDNVVEQGEFDDDLTGEDEDDGEDDEEAEHVQMSPEDIEKINQVAGLSQAELNKEVETLRARIESEDLFTKLEDGELTGQAETDAKEVLERFALLGLEGTRRQYMANEPELRDPIYAHRESLTEIRELLSDE